MDVESQRDGHTFFKCENIINLQRISAIDNLKQVELSGAVSSLT